MSDHQISAPVDKQQVTLPGAAAVVALAFALGAAWTTHESRFDAGEKRLEQLEQQSARIERLMNKACVKLQCDAEGMRE